MKKIIVVGILNITPDSFSDGGLYFNTPQTAIDRVREMLNQGADVIDIGGESTRPGSESVTAVEQIRRVIPVIQAIRTQISSKVPISIDTNNSTVTAAALEAGATIVNTLGGFTSDIDLAKTVARSGCQCVIYHILGTPKTMQVTVDPTTNILNDVSHFFEEQIALGLSAGMKKEQFILDPGIGFGKTLEQNLHLIKNMATLTSFELPLFIGVSRKSHLATILQQKLSLKALPEPNQRLMAALAETGIAIQNGVTWVRTHDVLETKQFISVLEEVM
jgi:dihydropteroate synthase